jgi:hypothetical protein
MTLSFANELTSIGLTAIGWQAGYNVTSSSYSVMIGHFAGESVTSGSNNVFIGNNSGNGIVGGTNNLHFATGEQLTNGDFSNSIHFGSGRANNRSLTFGVGTTTGTYLNNVYFGAGFSTTNTLGGSGRGVTLQPTTESGKTDSSALNITLAGGIGTGAGTPGDVIISTATSGSTGSTLQTLTTRLVVKANTGNGGMGTTSPGDLTPNGWGSGGRSLEILGSSNESTGLFLRRGNFTGIGLDLWAQNGGGSSYIDNRYDSAGTSGVTIRVRTAGTPRTVAIFDDEFGAKLGDWTNNKSNAVRIEGDLSFRSGSGPRSSMGTFDRSCNWWASKACRD